MLRLGLERIERVDPLPGEDAALRVEDERLAHAEELPPCRPLGGPAHRGRRRGGRGSADGVTGALASARAAVAGAAPNDPELAELEARLVELAILASDLGSDLTRYAATVDLDPQRLGWVQQRRAQLEHPHRPVRRHVDEVLAWSARASPGSPSSSAPTTGSVSSRPTW